MKKPVLAIDVDEVLFPFTKQFLYEYNRKNGTALSIHDLTTFFYIEELTGLNGAEVEAYIKDFLHSDYGRSIKPHSGALEALDKLKAKYEIDIITSRHHTMVEITESWLKENFPDTFRNIHFPRPGDSMEVSKTDLCVELGVAILIDDHPNNLLDCAKKGIHGLCFGDYPWNQADKMPDSIQRVKDWDEVLKVLL